MILSDLSILERMQLEDSNPKRIRIKPFVLDHLQGASVDVRLGLEVIYRGRMLSLPERLEGKKTPDHKIFLSEDQKFLLPPHHVCLASTYEYIHTPSDCVLRVEGVSTVGRQFVSIHQTAGWCDPGFYGNITLEIVNSDPDNFFLMEAYMRIGQITYLQLDREAERQYKGRYQGDLGPVEAR